MDYEILSEEFLKTMLWPKKWESGDTANLTIDQARSLAKNSFIAGLKKNDEVNKIIAKKFSESLLRSHKLNDALKQLVHLHSCEQECLSSGKPTPQMWFDAVNNAAALMISEQEVQECDANGMIREQKTMVTKISSK